MFTERQILKVLQDTGYRIVTGTDNTYFNMPIDDIKVLAKEFMPIVTSYLVKRYKEVQDVDSLKVLPGSWLAYSALDAAEKDVNDIGEGYPYIAEDVLVKLIRGFNSDIDIIKKVNDVVNEAYRYLKDLPSKVDNDEPVFNVMELVLLDPETGFLTSESVNSIFRPYNIPQMSLDKVNISYPKITREDVKDLDLGYPDIKVALDVYMEDHPLEYEYSVEDVLKMLDWDNLSSIYNDISYLDAYVLAALTVKKILITKEKELDNDTIFGLQAVFNYLLKRVKLYTKPNEKLMIVSVRDDNLNEIDTLLYTSDLKIVREQLGDGTNKVLNGFSLRYLGVGNVTRRISLTIVDKLVEDSGELAKLYDNYIKNYNYQAADHVRKELIGKYMLAVDKFYELLTGNYAVSDENRLKDMLNVSYMEHVKYRDDIMDMDETFMDIVADGLYAANVKICDNDKCLISGKYHMFRNLFESMKNVTGSDDMNNLLLVTYMSYVVHTLFRLGVR